MQVLVVTLDPAMVAIMAARVDEGEVMLMAVAADSKQHPPMDHVVIMAVEAVVVLRMLASPAATIVDHDHAVTVENVRAATDLDVAVVPSHAVTIKVAAAVGRLHAPMLVDQDLNNVAVMARAVIVLVAVLLVRSHVSLVVPPHAVTHALQCQQPSAMLMTVLLPYSLPRVIVSAVRAMRVRQWRRWLSVLES